MTFGVQFTNSLGVSALDDERQSLRVYSRGTTVDLDAALQPLIDSTLALPNYKSMIHPWRRIAVQNITLTSPSSTFQRITVGTDRYALVPDDLSGVGGMSAFYKITTEMRFACEMEMDLDPGAFSARTMCYTEGLREFALTAPVSKPSYTETHGMQIFNAAGEKTFDSRDDFLPVRYASFIPKAVIDDVLTNGTVKTITLPEAMPNAWVSVPFLSCWSFVLNPSSVSVLTIGLTQTSSTTIRVRRVGLMAAPTNIPRPYYSHDVVFYVAPGI